jgi:hypothetical protein
VRRKWLIIVVPLLFLLVSVGIMAGGSFLKQPMGEDDRLLEAIQQLEKKVKGKDWKQANERSTYAMKAWKKVVNRIQFSTEREYMLEISGVLSRIQGGIEAEDDKAIIEEIYYFYDLWDNLGR